MGDDGMYLKLAGENRTKRILSFRGGKIVKYVKKTNIFKPKEGKSLVGFNYHALKIVQEKSRQKCLYIQYGNSYQEVQIADIFSSGEFLHFLKEGFELQIFYPLDTTKK